MALKFGINTAIVAANSVVLLVDAGVDPGKLVIFDGTEPVAPGDAITDQVELASFTLPRPAFTAAVDMLDGAECQANPIDSVLAAASGTAAFFRVLDGDGVVVLQGSVTDNTGDGDVKISSTSVLSGVEVSVLSLDYTQPKA